jgi:hypothetical protein
VPGKRRTQDSGLAARRRSFPPRPLELRRMARRLSSTPFLLAARSDYNSSDFFPIEHRLFLLITFCQKSRANFNVANETNETNETFVDLIRLTLPVFAL